MGSAKTVVPPWGGDSRVGDRALKWVLNTLKQGPRKNESLGTETTIQHDVTLVDPIDVFGPDGALTEISAGELTTPIFFLKELRFADWKMRFWEV